MSHKHCYQPIAYTTLTLPDCDGNHEAHRTWECLTCGKVWAETMYMYGKTHGMDPIILEQIRINEHTKKRPHSIVTMQTIGAMLQWKKPQQN